MNINNTFIKKIIIFMFIFLTLFNFIYSSGHKVGLSFATESDVEISSTADDLYKDTSEAHTNGSADAATTAAKYIIVPVCTALQGLLISLSISGGLNETINPTYITPLDIFFNKFKIIDINIFSLDGLDEDNMVYKIRSHVAMWYSILYIIANIAVLFVLVINTIIAISKDTSATQKAVAKEAIKNWLFTMIFMAFINLFMIVIINFNEVIIKAIENNVTISSVGDVIDKLSEAIFAPNYDVSLTALIIYLLLMVQTAVFFVRYIQRFLTVIVLIFTAPLIPVSYSLDKSTGENAMTLNAWAREFFYNVFLQPLDCVLYAGITGVAFSAVGTSFTSSNSFTTALISILAVFFIPFAEKLVRGILGFNNTQTIDNNVLKTAIFSTARTAKRMGNAVMVAGATVSMGLPMGVAVGIRLANKEKNFGTNMRGILPAQIGDKSYVTEKLNDVKNSLSDSASKVLDFDPQAAAKTIGLSDAIDKANGKDDKKKKSSNNDDRKNKKVYNEPVEKPDNNEDTGEKIIDFGPVGNKKKIDINKKDLEIIAGSSKEELDEFKKKFKEIDKKNESKKLWNESSKNILEKTRISLGEEQSDEIEEFVEEMLSKGDREEYSSDNLTDEEINKRFKTKPQREYARNYKDYLLDYENRMQKAILIQEFNVSAKENGSRTISKEEAEALKNARLNYDGSPDILDKMIVGDSKSERESVSKAAKNYDESIPEDVYSLASHYGDYINSSKKYSAVKNRIEKGKADLRKMNKSVNGIPKDEILNIEFDISKLDSKADLEKYMSNLSGKKKSYARQYGLKSLEISGLQKDLNIQAKSIQEGKEKLQADVLKQRKSSTTLFDKNALKSLEDTIKRTYKENSALSKDDMTMLKKSMERAIESYDMESMRTDTVTEEITDEITEKTRILKSTTHVDTSYSKRVAASMQNAEKKINAGNAASQSNTSTKK